MPQGALKTPRRNFLVRARKKDPTREEFVGLYTVYVRPRNEWSLRYGFLLYKGQPFLASVNPPFFMLSHHIYWITPNLYIYFLSSCLSAGPISVHIFIEAFYNGKGEECRGTPPPSKGEGLREYNPRIQQRASI